MGAEGMLGAEAGPDSYRQWYLAPDVSFSRIPVRGKALRTLFFLLDAVKLPAPAVEYRGQGVWRGHWLGF